MTRNNDTPYRRKGLSVFLTVLMVLSVVAMSATFVGTVAASNHADQNITGGDVGDGFVYQGQLISINQTAVGDENVDLERVTDRSGGNASNTQTEELLEGSSHDGGSLNISTTDLEEGDYVLESPDGYLDSSGEFDGDLEDASEFEVVIQEMTAEFEEDEVNEGESVDLTVESSLRNDYNVNVSADGDLTVSELEDIFGPSIDDEDDEVITIEDFEGTTGADFTDIDPGAYDFEFNVTDTSASDTASIEVGEAPDLDIEFSDSTYNAVEGDVATFTAELSEGTEEATIFIGGEDSGYLAAADVVDEDEDGIVTVSFNTYVADETSGVGGTFLAFNDPDADIENSVNDITYAGNFGGEDGDVTADLDTPLPAGEYDLRVSPDANMDDGDVENETDVASLILEEQSLDGVDIGAAPSADADEDEDAPDIADALTGTDQVAEGDRLVVEVNGNGFWGALPLGEDIVRQQLNNSYDTPDEGNWTLTLSQEQTGVADSSYIDIEGDDAYYVGDSINESAYLVVDTDEVSNTLDRDLQGPWNATFTLGDEYGFHDEDNESQSVSSTFDIVETNHEFDNVNDDDEVQILYDEEAEVSGETNLAPGTEFDLRLRGSDLIAEDEIEVQSDGSWNVTVDTTTFEDGEEIEVELGGSVLEDETAVGVLVDEIEEPPSDDEIEALEDEIAALEDELADAESTNTDLQSELDGANEEVSDLETQVEELSSERDSLQSDIDDALDEAGADDLDDLVSMADGGDDDENPAFGPIAALIAILAGGAVAARRRL